MTPLPPSALLLQQFENEITPTLLSRLHLSDDGFALAAEPSLPSPSILELQKTVAKLQSVDRTLLAAQNLSTADKIPHSAPPAHKVLWDRTNFRHLA